MPASIIEMNKTRIEIQPLGDQVAFKPHKVSETRQGVLLPDVVTKDGMSGVYDTPSGTVLAVGPDCKTVKVGDVILVAQGQGVYNAKRGRADWLMLPEGAILAVIKDL